MNTILRQVGRQSRSTHSLRSGFSLATRFYSNTTATSSSSTTEPPNFTKSELEKLVRTNKVVVFMKGNPELPRCGFSNAVVQIMRMHGVEYDAHDVMKNEELRQSIKEFTDWPTIPQVFINGEFVGGCDILLQMHQSGDLIEELKKAGIQSSLLKAEKDSENQNKEKN